MTPLPTALAGPVEFELAKLEETIPAERRMAGGSVYELKFDGYRLVIVRTDQGVRLWSRNGSDLTERFPDIAAAGALPEATVLDGEVVTYHNARLSFDLLQQRLGAGKTALADLCGAPVRDVAAAVAQLMVPVGNPMFNIKVKSVNRQCLSALTGVVLSDAPAPVDGQTRSGDVAG